MIVKFITLPHQLEQLPVRPGARPGRRILRRRMQLPYCQAGCPDPALPVAGKLLTQGGCRGRSGFDGSVLGIGSHGFKLVEL